MAAVVLLFRFFKHRDTFVVSSGWADPVDKLGDEWMDEWIGDATCSQNHRNRNIYQCRVAFWHASMSISLIYVAGVITHSRLILLSLLALSGAVCRTRWVQFGTILMASLNDLSISVRISVLKVKSTPRKVHFYHGTPIYMSIVNCGFGFLVDFK